MFQKVPKGSKRFQNVPNPSVLSEIPFEASLCEDWRNQDPPNRTKRKLISFFTRFIGSVRQFLGKTGGRTQRRKEKRREEEACNQTNKNLVARVSQN